VIAEVEHSDDDPLLKSARREAGVTLCIFLAALAYTIGYCTLKGYDAAPEGLELVLGVPSWVMWGVFAPWGVCTLFHCWFSMAFMQDHKLEDPAAPPDAEGATQED
jgi:hypothetical protein